MVVTGSRLQSALGEQAPVLSIGQRDLERPGLVSVGDILQRLPASGGAINGKSNSSGNFGGPPDGGGIGAGAIEMDLRFLGSKRVLVLVDGLRWVAGSSASGVAAGVDLNTIPLNMIERIEVLEDGASPIYGSDAIAGVVNIITRKKFKGAAANAYVGAFHPLDGFTQKYDLTLGTSDERLSLVFGASYLDQREVSSADRELSDSTIPGLDACEAGCSSATPQGRVVFTNPNTGEAFDLTLRNGTGMPSFPDDYVPFSPSAAFNYAPYNLVLTPTRRVSVFTTAVYELASAIRLRGKAVFTRRESANQAAPEPLFVGPEGGTQSRMDRIGVDASNPYNPFGFTFDPRDNPFVITRRPLEAGPRRFEQTVNTFVLSGGFEGNFELGARPFAWDTTVTYGINRADQRRRNAFNSAKLQQALGPGFVDVDGSLRCGTMASRGDPECVPFNIFGGQGADGRGTITRAMLDYVTYTQHDVSEQHLLDWVANINGELATLPGGPLAVGIGVEHRRLRGYFEPDAVVAAGDSADVPALPTSGAYHVTEYYAEARAPFLGEIPGIDLFELNAAGRISDYSLLDPEATGKLGARYKPIDDLVIRASYGLGFRAPSIGELYASASRFDAQLSDPCSDFNRPEVPESVRQRCIELGVPSDGSYSQLNPQISVRTGGNRELQPERSKSVNVSLAYAPSPLQDRGFSDRFEVELAYYDIRVSRAITALDAQLQIDRCVDGDESQCEGITRTVAGSINGFRNELQNIGAISTRGIDLKVDFQTASLPSGRWRAQWLSSWMFDYWEEVRRSSGTETVKLEGRVVGEPERAFPQLKSNLVLEWLYGDFALAFTTRYIHGLTEACRDLQDFPGKCSDPNTEVDALSTNELSPTVYNDLRVTWLPAFDPRLTITAGVNNLFNADPPACFSCALNGFNPSTYDVPGVFGYLNAGYRLE
jgi:iron complex outermembrane receptor protein